MVDYQPIELSAQLITGQWCILTVTRGQMQEYKKTKYIDLKLN